MDVFDLYDDAWLRTNLTQLAIMAEQLRKQAKMREEEQRAHLRLVPQYDEPPMPRSDYAYGAD